MIANKREAPEGATVTNRCKGTHKNRTKATIKALFLRGGKYTAKELNELSYGNDARKCISRLRREGMDIQDLWQPDHRKLYWVTTEDNKQLSFWTRWEGVSYE